MQAGYLVLLKVDSIKISRWQRILVGRIIENLPGNDGRIRVACIKTAQGTYIRPTAKMCLLKACKSEKSADSSMTRWMLAGRPVSSPTSYLVTLNNLCLIVLIYREGKPGRRVNNRSTSFA